MSFRQNRSPRFGPAVTKQVGYYVYYPISFTDNFATQDAAKWTYTNATATGGVAVFTANMNGTLDSVNSYDISGGGTVGLQNISIDDGGSFGSSFALGLYDPGNDNISFGISRLSGNGAISATASQTNGASAAAISGFVWATHPYIRIRIDDTTVYWEYSTNNVSWTTGYSEPIQPVINRSALTIHIATSQFGSTGTYSIDNFALDGLRTETTIDSVVATESSSILKGESTDTAIGTETVRINRPLVYLVDDFATQDTDKWTSAGNMIFTGGIARFNATSASITSVSPYNAVNSEASFNLTSIPTGGTTRYLNFYVYIDGIASSNYVWIQLSRSAATLKSSIFVSAVEVATNTISRVAAAGDWYRIRNDGTNTIAEYSTDGIAWTNILSYSGSVPFLTATQVWIVASLTGTQTGKFEIDNFNLLPVPTPVSSSDTAVATDTGSFSAALVSSDTATGTDTESAVPSGSTPISDSDTSTATDSGTVAVASSFVDTFVATDSQTSSATQSSTDTSTAIDSSTSPVVTLTSADTAIGTESSTQAASSSALDTSVATDSVASRTFGATDTSTSTDSQSATATNSFTDNALGTETATVSVSLSNSDTGVGTDTGSVTSATQTNSDSGVGTDSIASRAIATADTSVGTEATGDRTFGATDTGAGTDSQSATYTSSFIDNASSTETQSISVSLTATDTSLATETQTNVTSIVSTDSANATESVATRTLGNADSVLGTDAVQSRSIATTDSVLGTETIVSRTVGAADSSTASDSQSAIYTSAFLDNVGSTDSASVAATISSSDTVLGTEYQSISTAGSFVDSVVGAETATVSVSSSFVDSVIATESQTLVTSAFVSSSDSANSSEMISLSVSISGVDSSTGVDSQAVSVALSGLDSEASAENALLSVVLSDSDSAVGTESATVAVLLFTVYGSDSVVGTESAIVYAEPIRRPIGTSTGTSLVGASVASVVNASSLDAHTSSSSTGTALVSSSTKELVLASSEV